MLHFQFQLQPQIVVAQFNDSLVATVHKTKLAVAVPLRIGIVRVREWLLSLLTQPNML